MADVLPSEAVKNMKDATEAKDVGEKVLNDTKKDLVDLRALVKEDLLKEWKDRTHKSNLEYHNKLHTLEKRIKNYKSKAKPFLTEAAVKPIDDELETVDKEIKEEKKVDHPLNPVEKTLGIVATPFVWAGHFMSETVGPTAHQGFSWLNQVLKPIGDTFKALPGQVKEVLAKGFDLVGFSKGAKWLRGEGTKTPEQLAKASLRQEYDTLASRLKFKGVNLPTYPDGDLLPDEIGRSMKDLVANLGSLQTPGPNLNKLINDIATDLGAAIAAPKGYILEDVIKSAMKVSAEPLDTPETIAKKKYDAIITKVKAGNITLQALPAGEELAKTQANITQMEKHFKDFSDKKGKNEAAALPLIYEELDPPGPGVPPGALKATTMEKLLDGAKKAIEKP